MEAEKISPFEKKITELADALENRSALIDDQLRIVHRGGWSWLWLRLVCPFYTLFGKDAFSHLRINQVAEAIFKYVEDNQDENNSRAVKDVLWSALKKRDSNNESLQTLLKKIEGLTPTPPPPPPSPIRSPKPVESSSPVVTGTMQLEESSTEESENPPSPPLEPAPKNYPTLYWPKDSKSIGLDVAIIIDMAKKVEEIFSKVSEGYQITSQPSKDQWHDPYEIVLTSTNEALSNCTIVLPTSLYFTDLSNPASGLFLLGGGGQWINLLDPPIRWPEEKRVKRPTTDKVISVVRELFRRIEVGYTIVSQKVTEGKTTFQLQLEHTFSKQTIHDCTLSVQHVVLFCDISKPLEGVYLMTDKAVGKGATREPKECIDLLTRSVCVYKPVMSPTELAIAKFSEISGGIQGVVPVQVGKIDDKTSFLIEEYYDGTLKDLLSKGVNSKEISKLYFDLLSALTVLNRKGWYHGDINLVNVLYKKMPTGEIKFGFTDFGSAALKDLSGTVPFLCPLKSDVEALKGLKDNEKIKLALQKSDIWSLGILLADLLSKPENVPSNLKIKPLEGGSGFLGWRNVNLDVREQRLPDLKFLHTTLRDKDKSETVQVFNELTQDIIDKELAAKIQEAQSEDSILRPILWSFVREMMQLDYSKRPAAEKLLEEYNQKIPQQLKVPPTPLRKKSNVAIRSVFD